MAKHELTINLPDDVLEEIEKYKIAAHKKSTEEAVTELIRQALTLPAYFREFDWEKAEAEADEEITSGKIKSFDSIEDFLADLKK